MAVTLHFLGEQKYVEVQMTGKLTAEDYKKFVPQLDQLFDQYGSLRLLVEMRDFHGWDMGALWEDIKFDTRHFKDVERLALVGETKWQEWMATFCKPFTTAKIKYFEGFELQDARDWLTKERPDAPPATPAS